MEANLLLETNSTEDILLPLSAWLSGCLSKEITFRLKFEGHIMQIYNRKRKSIDAKKQDIVASEETLLRKQTENQFN